MYNQQLQGALADVAEDLENIRTAWDWAIAQGDLEVLEPAIVALYRFFWTRSRGREGADLFARSLVQLEQATGVQNHPRYEFVRRSLIHQRGMFYYFLGDYEAAEQDMIWSLVLARKLALQTPLGDALVILGAISVWQGDWSTALERLRESYTIFEQIGHRDGLADVLQELSMHHLHFGEFARGKALATESLTICHELDRPDWTAWAHDALGWSCFLLGEYEVARTHYETSLAIFDRLGHERGRALALGGFGMVAWAQGGEQLGHAKGWLQQSLEICRKIGFRLHIASRLAMMALVLNELGDYQAAQAHAQDGLALASETGSRLFIVYNLFCLVETAYRQADFFTARGYLREVLMLTSQTGLLPSLASGLYHAGVLLALEVQQAVVDAAAAPSQLARAVQLLTLVAQHPACWSAFRTRAQQKLTQFVVQLPAELSPAVQAQSRMLDLHSAAEDLLALL